MLHGILDILGFCVEGFYVHDKTIFKGTIIFNGDDLECRCIAM